MSEFDDCINAGMREFEGQKPSMITIGTETYPGVFSDLKLQDVAEFGGYSETAEATFMVRKELLATRPEDNKRVTVTRAGVTKTYRIESVEDDDPVWDIVLKGATK